MASNMNGNKHEAISYHFTCLNFWRSYTNGLLNRQQDATS